MDAVAGSGRRRTARAVFVGRGLRPRQGVEKDEVEAYKWAQLSAQNGDLSGSDLRSRLERRLKKKQIEEGKKRASEFRPKTE